MLKQLNNLCIILIIKKKKNETKQMWDRAASNEMKLSVRCLVLIMATTQNDGDDVTYRPLPKNRTGKKK